MPTHWMTMASAPVATNDGGAQTALALLVLIAAIVGWVALRSFVRGLRARKTQVATGGRYADYVMEVLVNAAKIDGRVSAQEIAAIGAALSEAGAATRPEAIQAALQHASLSKDELVAFLAARSSTFSHHQKTALLKALLAVFVADDAFDEIEHAALVDYTSAVGFDRQSAADRLRGIARDFRRGDIT